MKSDLLARQFHTSVPYEKNLIIFGGKSNGYKNDLLQFGKFDIDHQTTHVEDLNAVTVIDTKGTKPSPRYGHSAIIWKNKMIVFGGYDSSSLASNELFEYNLGIYDLCIYNIPESYTWSLIQASTPLPAGRFTHGCCVVDNEMFIFGGISDNTPLNDVWSLNLGT